MDLCDLAPAYIRAIAPYQAGKAQDELERELGIRGAIKLASNENPLGASPHALQAIQASLAGIARYPDSNGYHLKDALAQIHALTPEHITLGNGSNEVLELSARAFLGPGTSALYAQHAFAVYALITQATGATGIEVPARKFAHDLEAMAAAVQPSTHMVFLANPNNPTGSLALPHEIAGFLNKISPRIIVVLDEAYYEYIPDALRADSLGLLAQFPNLVLTRTFSKIFGLAGLRIGYALAHPHLSELLNRVRQPFNINSPAQHAALAALGDSAFVARSRACNAQGMQHIVDGLARLGLEYLPSCGNFVCLRVGHGMAVYHALLKEGVIVRPLDNYGLPEYLRVTVGLAEENARFLSALSRVLPATST
jgi:histidinol-phosphate aminotransferase